MASLRRRDGRSSPILALPYDGHKENPGGPLSQQLRSRVKSPGQVSSHFLDPSLDEDRRARLERVLALARLGLAVIAIVLVQADPQPPGVDSSLGVTLIRSYTIFALTAAALVALLTPFIGPLSIALHALDVAWILAITALGDRPATIFFVVSVYPVIGAGFRWGQKATGSPAW